MHINGVELVPERSAYKVDASGRIIIPSYMRSNLMLVQVISWIITLLMLMEIGFYVLRNIF